VVRQLLFHESLGTRNGLADPDASWRGVLGGLEALVSVKSIAVMITRMPEWLPSNVTAASFEKVTLLGPLSRLGVFSREWVRVLFAAFTGNASLTLNTQSAANVSTELLFGP
jgi:ubiquitin conjugation factor E4 B